MTMWQWPATRAAQKEYRLSLRTTPETLMAYRSALGKVVKVVHQATKNVSVLQVVTGGSVGKHTASNVGSDLDLVVYVADLARDDGKIGASIARILDSIQAAMDLQYPDTRDVAWHRKYSLRYNIAGTQIDILVGVPNVQPVDFLSMPDSAHRNFLSASVSHLSKQFIMKQNLLFKDMVRIVKHWRDTSGKWSLPEFKPKSYLIEVLMLHAFRSYGMYDSQSNRTCFRAKLTPYWFQTRLLIRFFQLVAKVKSYPVEPYHRDNLPRLFVCFEKFYQRAQLPLDSPEPIFVDSARTVISTAEATSKTRRVAAAVVMDPTNPTNNLWLTLGDGGEQFVARATSTLRILLLQEKHRQKNRPSEKGKKRGGK
jgi:2'-5'-oligoadenylate synthetase 1, domain 2, C-terminus